MLMEMFKNMNLLCEHSLLFRTFCFHHACAFPLLSLQMGRGQMSFLCFRCTPHPVCLWGHGLSPSTRHEHNCIMQKRGVARWALYPEYQEIKCEVVFHYDTVTSLWRARFVRAHSARTCHGSTQKHLSKNLRPLPHENELVCFAEMSLAGSRLVVLVTVWIELATIFWTFFVMSPFYF